MWHHQFLQAEEAASKISAPGSGSFNSFSSFFEYPSLFHRIRYLRESHCLFIRDFESRKKMNFHFLSSVQIDRQIVDNYGIRYGIDMVFKSDSLMKTGFTLKAARISCSGQTETCEQWNYDGVSTDLAMKCRSARLSECAAPVVEMPL